MKTVSKSALIARLRRICKKEGQRLVISRGESDRNSFGEAYILDLGTNGVVANGYIEDLAVELLKYDEKIEKEA